MNGTNYFCKVQIQNNPDVFVHARIHTPLRTPHSPELVSIRTDVKSTDPLAYF